jgi:hypothetical protein
MRILWIANALNRILLDIIATYKMIEFASGNVG